MPIDSRVGSDGQGVIGAVILVAALGGGWYLVPDDFSGDLQFIEVGWWNIRDLSSSSRDDSEIVLIAQAIGDIDVLAVGELNDPDALRRIAEELGPSWRWDATDAKIGRSASSAEYYGFLWDSDLVSMIGDVNVFNDAGDEIDREPAWATFRTANAGLDFTLMCVHITWGGGVTARKNEILAIADGWDDVIAEADDEDLILMGDFNLKIGHAGFDPLIETLGLIRANEDTGPTHISSSTTYDQIFLSLDATSEWTGEWGTVAFDESLFNNNDSAANLACSDHRPVWIALYVTDEDDD